MRQQSPSHHTTNQFILFSWWVSLDLRFVSRVVSSQVIGYTLAAWILISLLKFPIATIVDYFTAGPIAVVVGVFIVRFVFSKFWKFLGFPFCLRLTKWRQKWLRANQSKEKLREKQITKTKTNNHTHNFKSNSTHHDSSLFPLQHLAS